MKRIIILSIVFSLTIGITTSVFSYDSSLSGYSTNSVGTTSTTTGNTSGTDSKTIVSYPAKNYSVSGGTASTTPKTYSISSSQKSSSTSGSQTTSATTSTSSSTASTSQTGYKLDDTQLNSYTVDSGSTTTIYPVKTYTPESSLTNTQQTYELENKVEPSTTSKTVTDQYQPPLVSEDVKSLIENLSQNIGDYRVVEHEDGLITIYGKLIGASLEYLEYVTCDSIRGQFEGKDIDCSGWALDLRRVLPLLFSSSGEIVPLLSTTCMSDESVENGFKCDFDQKDSDNILSVADKDPYLKVVFLAGGSIKSPEIFYSKLVASSEPSNIGFSIDPKDYPVVIGPGKEPVRIRGKLRGTNLNDLAELTCSNITYQLKNRFPDQDIDCKYWNFAGKRILPFSVISGFIYPFIDSECSQDLAVEGGFVCVIGELNADDKIVFLNPPPNFSIFFMAEGNSDSGNLAFSQLTVQKPLITTPLIVEKGPEVVVETQSSSFFDKILDWVKPIFIPKESVESVPQIKVETGYKPPEVGVIIDKPVIIGEPIVIGEQEGTTKVDTGDMWLVDSRLINTRISGENIQVQQPISGTFTIKEPVVSPVVSKPVIAGVFQPGALVLSKPADQLQVEVAPEFRLQNQPEVFHPEGQLVVGENSKIQVQQQVGIEAMERVGEAGENIQIQPNGIVAADRANVGVAQVMVDPALRWIASNVRQGHLEVDGADQIANVGIEEGRVAGVELGKINVNQGGNGRIVFEKVEDQPNIMPVAKAPQIVGGPVGMFQLEQKEQAATPLDIPAWLKPAKEYVPSGLEGSDKSDKKGSVQKKDEVGSSPGWLARMRYPGEGMKGGGACSVMTNLRPNPVVIIGLMIAILPLIVRRVQKSFKRY